MIGYYTGRFLQLAGLVIMAESLVLYFGQELPLLKGSLLAVALFYLGYFLVRKYGSRDRRSDG